MVKRMTKNLVMVGMVVMVIGFSGIATAALFEDDFEGGTVIDTAKWDVETYAASGGTAYVEDEGTYAKLYTYKPDTNNYAHLTTKDSFSIGSGLDIDTTILFHRSGPGGGSWYDRPYMALQDADGNNQLVVYSPFSSGDTSAPIKILAKQSGTLTLDHTTPSTATSHYVNFKMDVTSTSTTFKLYDDTDTKIDEWTTTYDSISDLKVRYGVGCNGYWPASEMYVDHLTIVPEPATIGLMLLGLVGLIRRR